VTYNGLFFPVGQGLFFPLFCCLLHVKQRAKVESATVGTGVTGRVRGWSSDSARACVDTSSPSTPARPPSRRVHAALARTRAPSGRASLLLTRALPRGAPPSAAHACSFLGRRLVPHARGSSQCRAQMHSGVLPGGAPSRFALALGARRPPCARAPDVAAPNARSALPPAFSPFSPRACERGDVFLFGWGCAGWVLGDKVWRVRWTTS